MSPIKNHAEHGQVHVDLGFAGGDFLFAGIGELLAINLHSVRLIGFQISAANLAFHQGIVRAAGNTRLLLIIEGLWVLPLVARKFALFDRASLEQSISHHREITRALRAHDGDWASAIMRAHILAARGYDSMLAGITAEAGKAV